MGIRKDIVREVRNPSFKFMSQPDIMRVITEDFNRMFPNVLDRAKYDFKVVQKTKYIVFEKPTNKSLGKQVDNSLFERSAKNAFGDKTFSVKSKSLGFNKKRY